MNEATGLPYASTVPGRMHGCGHDGHMVMLLAAAEYLCETRAFDGTVAVIFQPAEEGGGGAKVMCEAGLMERFCDYRGLRPAQPPRPPAGRVQHPRGRVLCGSG